jgi:membrane protease subunit (stomatin/prohibitin family)
MRFQPTHFGLVIVLAGGLVLPAFSAAEKAPQRQQPAATQKQEQKQEKTSGGTIPVPKDCDQIGSGTTGSVPQAAAKKDCEASKHLGADSGTSSGTGSGKMQSGSGPR